MLVDLSVRGKTAVVVGTREHARSRVRQLTREGARVQLAGNPNPGRSTTRVRASRATDPVEVVRRVRPILVFSTEGDPRLNERIVRAARAVGALVHVYDAPLLSDFTLPSVGVAGAIRVAVSSSGQSPAMAALLRRRIERRIRPIDVAQVRLQGRLRPLIHRSIPTFEERKRTIYRILRHREIRRLLRTGHFDKALALARRLVAASATRMSGEPHRGK